MEWELLETYGLSRLGMASCGCQRLREGLLLCEETSHTKDD